MNRQTDYNHANSSTVT